MLQSTNPSTVRSAPLLTCKSQKPTLHYILLFFNPYFIVLFCSALHSHNLLNFHSSFILLNSNYPVLPSSPKSNSTLHQLCILTVTSAVSSDDRLGTMQYTLSFSLNVMGQFWLPTLTTISWYVQGTFNPVPQKT